MAVLIALLFIVALWDVAKTAVKHTSAGYGRSRDARVRQAGSLTPQQRRSVIRRHRAGYWTREAARGFPVTRTGLHTGWQAHRTDSLHEKHKREEARTTTLETLAALLPSLRDHRARQEKARQDIEQEQARGREAQGTGVPPLPSETVEPKPERDPFAVREDARPDDSVWLRPGQKRCPVCDGSGSAPQGGACPYCRGWGSDDDDPAAPLAAPGTICNACGHPGTDEDPVLTDGYSNYHRSHARQAAEDRREAAATNGNGSKPPATEGEKVPTGTASADVTYDQLQAEATKVVNEAEQQLASLRASQLSNMVEGMAGMVNDSNSLSRAAEIDEAIREQMKAAQQTLDAAQAFKDGLRRDHGGINDAVQDAPIPKAAQPEFYDG